LKYEQFDFSAENESCVAIFIFPLGVDGFCVDVACTCQKTHFKRTVLIDVIVFFSKNLILKKKRK